MSQLDPVPGLPRLMNGIVRTGQRDAHPTGPRPTTVDCDDNGGRCVRLNGV